MTLLADLAKRKPRQTRTPPSLEPRLETCSLCAGSGRFPDCLGCNGEGTVTIVPPWPAQHLQRAQKTAAQASKRDVARLAKAQDAADAIAVPIRPAGYDDEQWAAVLELGWHDSGPPGGVRHSQLRLMGL